MTSVEDFPYDPRAVVEMLNGLEKLRTVKDRSVAALLHDLYYVAVRNELDPEFRSREQHRQTLLGISALERLQTLAAAAFAGHYGQPARELANTMLVDDQTFGSPRRTDQQSLEAFADALQGLRRESHG